jgi:hypothetical protein
MLTKQQRELERQDKVVNYATPEFITIKKETMTREEEINIVRAEVETYLDDNAQWTGLSEISQSERSHIIEIGTSILCTKWKVGYEGGSFVQSFVANDLMGAIGRADTTSYKGFKFFASLIYNVGIPTKLLK